MARVKGKKCCHCKRILAVGEFNKSRSNKDGLHRVCKECRREERVRCAGRIYIQKQRWYSHNKERNYLKSREWIAKNPERQLEYQRKYRENNRDRTRARAGLNNAIKRGEVKRLMWCQLCGRGVHQRVVEAHHADYSQPLSVVWLCKSHHHQIHFWLRNQEAKVDD